MGYAEIRLRGSDAIGAWSRVGRSPSYPRPGALSPRSLQLDESNQGPVFYLSRWMEPRGHTLRIVPLGGADLAPIQSYHSHRYCMSEQGQSQIHLTN